MWAMVLIVGSYLIYHLCQRLIKTTSHPAISLLATYTVAWLISFGYVLLSPAGRQISAQLKNLNWASYGLAVGVVGLELGFLLAYQSGWQIGTASLYSNVAVTFFLLPIGFYFFNERLQPINILGIGLALVGLFLMSLKARV